MSINGLDLDDMLLDFYDVVLDWLLLLHHGNMILVPDNTIDYTRNSLGLLWQDEQQFVLYIPEVD
jgi:hypothetical protein